MSVSGGNKGTVYSKLVSISSSNLTSGTTTNFSYNTGATLQQILRVSVAHASFFNNFYNIHNDLTGDNTTYSYSYNATNYTYTLPQGFYNVNQILNLLNANLLANTGVAGLQWTFDSISNLVNFTVPIMGGTFQMNPGGNPNLGLVNTLGLVAYTTFTAPASSTTLIATHFPFLSGPTQVYIRSNALAPSNSIEVDGAFSNTLVAIPVTAAPLNLNVFECKVDNFCEIVYGNPRNFSQIDIQLTDRFGNVLDLHGGSLNLELRVWYNVY